MIATGPLTETAPSAEEHVGLEYADVALALAPFAAAACAAALLVHTGDGVWRPDPARPPSSATTAPRR